MTDNANTFGSGTFGGQFGSSQSAHVAQLISDALVATGVSSQDTTYRERALVFANDAYLALLQGRHWKFTNKELTLNLPPKYNTGTVKVTQGSDIVVEDVDVANGATSQVQWNVRHLNGMFTIGSDDKYYRVHELEGSKKLQIRPSYNEATASFQSYKIIPDRVSIEAKVQDIKSFTIHGSGEIRAMGLQQFREMKECSPTTEGSPRYFTVVDHEEDSGQMTVELYPSPDKQYAATIEFSIRPTRLEDSETCFPLIPPQHMVALAYAVRAEIYRYQNNDAMAREYGRLAAEAFSRMASDHSLTDPVARIQHGRKYFNRRQRYKGYYGLNHFGKVED